MDPSTVLKPSPIKKFKITSKTYFMQENNIATLKHEGGQFCKVWLYWNDVTSTPEYQGLMDNS